MKDLDWTAIMRCAFSVDIDGWEEGRDAIGAHAALTTRGLGATTKACKRIQEVGLWVLDVMWTVVMVNAGKADPKVQYLLLFNLVIIFLNIFFYFSLICISHIIE